MPHPTLPALPKADSHGLAEDIRFLIGVVGRGWRIVAVAVLVCLTMALVFLARKKLEYCATSRLLVMQQVKSPLNVTGGGSGRLDEGAEDYLPTHAMILRSPMVLERAAKSLGPEGPSMQQVAESLAVSRPDPMAKILQIEYRSGDPGQAVKVVNATIESYTKFLEDNYQKKNQNIIQLIRRARDELGRELHDLERKYLELRRDGPSVAADEASRTFLARRLEQWDHAATEAMIKGAQLKTQLDLGRKLAGEGATAGSISRAIGQLGVGTSPGTDPREAGDLDADLGDRLQNELTNAEIQRAATEHLLEQLWDRGAESVQAKAVDDEELARSFNADPAVAKLRAELASVREKLGQVRRLVRDPSDVSVTHFVTQVRALEAEIEKSWRLHRQSLMDQLASDRHDAYAAEVREAKVNIATSKARESSLRDKLARLAAARLQRLEEQERRLAARLGPEHPSVREARERVARVREDGPEAADRRDRGGASELLGTIEKSLESLDGMRSEIRKHFDVDLAAAQKAETSRLTVAGVQSELERQRTLFNTVVDQLKQAQLVGDFSGVTAQAIYPPTASPVRPRAAFLIGLALVSGLVLGVAIALLGEHMDQRLHSVDEIRKALNVAVIGLIPRLPGLVMPGGAGLICHLMPRSPLAEGFRVVRTNLDLQSRNRRVQVILVTSPLSGDGKTTTASNLAISLAHTGRRILLIDADLRRPMLDAIHDLTMDSGLAQVLQDRLPFHQAIQPTSIRNLDLITAGTEAPNPAELLTSPRLAEIIESARQSYDTVVIDAPPLLAVADPVILSGVADGILLVVRASGVRRHDAERTVELCETIGTPVLGAVIHGTNFHPTGYRYGYGRVVYGRPDGAQVPAISDAKAGAGLTALEPLRKGQNAHSGLDDGRS